ncbi:hypothetical protein CRENPOLYSF2_160023 [Crenothrix polyspora]|uniref:Uncharacterized protein n=1 Tax=Crenothrix polyspora TaxID=360316 RepID=A0A1R4H2S1_9GAMM|nr:hypothetical protein CRENPOLYSF2_160023 [Crenothrix polyspora]
MQTKSYAEYKISSYPKDRVKRFSIHGKHKKHGKVWIFWHPSFYA